jgi:hypothetical protein
MLNSAGNLERIKHWDLICGALSYIGIQKKSKPCNSNSLQAQRYIVYASKCLSRKYCIDADRIAAILQKTIADEIPIFWTYQRKYPMERGLSWCFLPSLSDAIEYLGPQTALELFENEPLERLRAREALTMYLQSNDAPLYSHKELAEIIDMFLKKLDHHKEFILKTGICPFYFPRSSWFRQPLGPLYPVKLPSGVRPRFDPDDDEYSTIDMSWQRIKQVDNNTIYVDCSYTDADYLPELQREACLRLIDMRPRLYQLKINILEELHSALLRKDNTGLWESCLNMITDSILGDEADFLLGMDIIYSGFDIRKWTTNDSELGMQSGGLSSIFEIIGNCLEELTIGAFSKTRDKLGNSAVEEMRTRSSPGINYFSLCALIDKYPQRTSDILDDFLSMEVEAEEFYQQYADKVNSALENEFYTEIKLQVRTRRKLVHRYMPYIRDYASFANKHFEIYGVAPSMSTPQLPQDSLPENIFRKEGQKWVVRFQGSETKYFNDILGMQYLYHLLQLNGNSIRVDELYHIVNKPSIDNEFKMNSIIDEYFNDEFSTVDIAADCADDGDSINHYRIALQNLEDEENIARRRGNSVELADVLKRKKDLLKFIQSNFGKRNLSRVRVDPLKRPRQAVSKAIKSALRQISKNLPSLYQHLSNSRLKIGTKCHYTPDPDINWITS